MARPKKEAVEYRPQKRVTKADRERYLEGLRKGMTVRQACDYGSHPYETFYKLMQRDPEFREAREIAMQAGTDWLEQEATRRAVEGVLEPVIGKVAPGIDGHVKDDEGKPMYVAKHSDRLMEVLLKGRRPEYRDNPRIDINNQTLHLTVEDRSAALSDVAKVLADAGVNVGEIIEGEATDVSDSGGGSGKELPRAS